TWACQRTPLTTKINPRNLNKFMKYQGYTIKRCKYQGTTCWQVTTPLRQTWPDLASNLETAKRWVDCHIAECKSFVSSLHIKKRLEHLRRELRAGRISYG